MEQYDENGQGKLVYYDRDIQDRIIGRYTSDVVDWNWVSTADLYYGHTADGDAPDFVRNTNWDIIEKHIQLPGGVFLTIKPQQTGNAAKSYNLPNIHDDTLLTTNAAGTNTSNGNGPLNSHLYDPFGNPVPGAVLPSNTAEASYAYVGQHQKLTESNLTLNPIQMGARVYLPGIGRFASVDPVDGGTENRYVYPGDPVNKQDLTGKAFWMPLVIGCIRFCKHAPKALKWGKRAWGFVRSSRVSVKRHDAHHPWRFPFQKKKKWYKHVEVRYWRKGVKKKPIRFQIPYGRGCRLKNCR
jgi:RHS repeat-associated protein